MLAETLTLAEAIKTKRLQEFIAQEKARGVATIDPKEFQEICGASHQRHTTHKQIEHRGRCGSSGK